MDAPQITPDTTRSADEVWDLSARWSKPLAVLGWIGSALTGAGTVLLVFAIFIAHRVEFLLAPMLVSLSMLFASIVVHECGHWLLGYLNGMTTVRVSLWRLELQPRRRGIRLRVRLRGTELAQGVYGMVVAYPDPGRDARKALMWMASGGALGNLALALVAGVAFMLSASLFSKGLWLALCLMNLALAAFNLLPRKVGLQSSDGLLILRAWRNLPHNLPNAAFNELMGRQLRGEAVASLPQNLLEKLASEPLPMPVIHDWLQLVAALQRHDWNAAFATAEAARARVETCEPAMRKALRDLLVLIHAEVSFAHAVVQGQPAPIEAIETKSPLFWMVPHLLPRLHALAAALRGDGARARELLEISRHHAENAIDRSLSGYELSLRTVVQSLIDGSPTAASGATSPGAKI